MNNISLGVSQSFFSLDGAEGSTRVWGSWCPWGVTAAGLWAEWGEDLDGSSPKEGQCLGWDGWAAPLKAPHRLFMKSSTGLKNHGGVHAAFHGSG